MVILKHQGWSYPIANPLVTCTIYIYIYIEILVFILASCLLTLIMYETDMRSQTMGYNQLLS